MRKEIHKCMFSHAGKQSNAPEALKRCPFYDDSTGCPFPDRELECRYHAGKSPPQDCPMKSGSVTLIFYIEGE
jgi:hypothetical protein